jgi:hypothetical protein
MADRPIAKKAKAAAQPEEEVSVANLRKQYVAFTADKEPELQEQRTARHYYHADQLTAAELAELRKRKQPPVIANRIQRKIDGIVGFIERLKQDPKAYPRRPPPQAQQGQQAEDRNGQEADLSTATVRYALDVCDWNDNRPQAARNGAIGGIGGVELTLTEGDHGDADVDMGLVDPETFFYDQRSTRIDFSDARFMGVAKWVDLDVAIEMFPDSEDELRDLVSNGGSVDGGLSQSTQMQDWESRWVNSTESQLFLIEHWYIKRGEWRWCFYCYDLLLANGTSPFRNEKGKTICRYIMFSANVDHDGDRYGFIRNLKPLQDEVNSRRSKALHLMHTRRIIAETGAVEDVEKARTEATRPDGYLEVNPNLRFEFDDVSKAQEWTAQIELLRESQKEIENFGPSAAILGEGGLKGSSGRAIQLLQQAGVAELGVFMLAYRGWKLRVYRALWSAVQATWTTERWVRVAGEEDAPEFLQLNGRQTNQYGQSMMVNALGDLDVDIILDEGPDTINLMEDTFDALKGLAQAGAPVPPEVLIEMSPLDAATKKRVMGLLEQAKQQNPLTLKQMELELAKLDAQIGEIKSKALKNTADAHAALQPDAPNAPAAPKGPSESINFKDIPPEAQSQMLAQVGIHIHPEILAAHAARQSEEKVNQAAQLEAAKAAHRPQPQQVS